jgi:hypothetical protein
MSKTSQRAANDSGAAFDFPPGRTRRLERVSKIPSLYPFSEPQIRWWLHNAATNGMKELGVVVRVGGRRIYIDLDAFSAWIDSQNKAVAA